MNNHVLVRLANLNRRNKPSTNHNASPNLRNSLLSSIQYAKASFRLPTPFFWPSKRVLVSPSFDFGTGEGRCVFSGDVGKSGRTRAVLRLSEDDSTLTFVRALDDSKVIAPTISLNSGKIVYDYYLNLDNVGRSKRSHDRHDGSCGRVDSSIRAHVDPTEGILLKWTDSIHGRDGGVAGGRDGSCWVAECRIPLGTTAPGSPLAADVRVGRRWVV